MGSVLRLCLAAIVVGSLSLVTPAAGLGSANASTSGAQPMLSLITEPEQGYGPIDRLLASAKHQLDMTMYELEDSTAEGILVADARRGVEVRVLLDRDYAGAANQAAFAYLSTHGVHVRWGSPQVAITHEKSFVVDGTVAVIMTGNLTSQYYSSTRDFAVVDRDPADVSAIERVFGLDWSDEQAVPPDGADLVWSPGSEQPLLELIDSAKRSLLVENEEMDAAAIVSALEDAARRGVSVEVIMTRSSDWDQNFDALAQAGVHVHTLSPYASLYIHAKVIDVDDHRVFIGSENFSIESMDYNRELGIVTTAPLMVGAITRTLEDDYASAQPWYA